MKMKLRHVVLALSLALPGAALAGSCPKIMAQVDAALAENPKLDEEVMKEIKILREEGEKQHAAGDHKKSVQSFNQALLLLGKL
jgi:hypothetical protein